MASTESIDRDSTPEPAIVKPVYGLLRQVSKKSGAEGQTIPIIATTIRLGRDPECDIRVFHESVSRRHVELSVHALPVGYEIKLKVIGRAGITYRPATADPVKLPTGTIQTLVTGDRFSIQKFTFSFQSVDPAAYLAETLSSISTPLPAQSSTPSTTAHHPSTPTPTPSSPLPQRVPAKIALSTPKGRMSLLKHTVLQSARKQWIAQKPSGLEAAMEDGQIEVRRKSTSPTKARASMSIQHEEEDDEESDEEDAENAGAGADHQEEITGHDLAAQQAEDSYESHEAEQDKDERVDLEQEGQAYDEDSAEDSLEADLSLDMAEDDEEIPIDPALLSENDAADYRTGDVEEGAQSASEAQSMEGEEYAEEHEGYEDEQAEGFTDIPIGDANGPTTPRVTRPLDAFYTPQVRHLGQAQQPRRSLAGIGAPAWRPAQYSAPVNPLASPAVRLGGRQVKVDQGAEVKIETPRKAEGSKDVGTPVRIKREEGGAGISAAQLAEMRKRRQSLGTPRALPAAPASFKTPVPSFSFSKQIHPALAGSASTPSIRAQPLTPSRQTDLHDAPPTPMQNIRNQIDALRLQAEERSSRRASVGLNSGATAGTGLGAGSTSMPVLSFATPARTQRYAAQRPTGTPMPLAPMLEAEKGNSSVSSINLSAMTTPTKGNMGTPFRLFKGEGTRSVAATPTAETDDAGAIPSSASPKAPSRAGTPGKVRQLVPSPSVFSTPASKPAASARHDPEEQTFKATAPSPQSYRTARTSPTPARSTSSTLNAAVQARQETQTPDYSGLKHMLHNQAPAATPEFKGIRDMLHRRVERSSVAGATRNKQGGHELAAPTYTGVRQLCPRLPAVGTPEMGGMGEMFASPSPTPRFQAVASAPASPQLAQVNKGKGKAEEGGSVEKEIIVSPVKNWLAVRAEQVNEESLAEEEEEEEEEEAREERAVETEYEHDQVQDDASEESSEEEQEEIEYRSPIVPRRTTRSSPIKLAAASTDGPAVKLLQSNASLSLASRSGSTSSRASRQASKSCSPSKAVDEEKEERASTVVQVANTVSRSRSTRTRTASPVKAVEPVDVNDPEESEEEQEEIEPPRRSQPASRSTRTASGRGAAIPEPTRTSAEEHPTGVASRSTRTVPVRTKVKTEPASTTNPAPARSTRKKAESVVAAAEALGETGVQGTVSRAPRGRAAAGKAVASAKIKTEPRAAEEEEEVVQVKETKSAPVRKTRTAAAATATASTATAPAPSKTSTSAASRTTRATRATRSKVFDTAAQEEKENVEERPSRSTRSRRA